MSGKDTLALSCDLDALLGREGARDNSHPYDNGRGRLASVPHANWVQTRPLHSIGVQIANHGGTDRGLPDLSERVQANRARLLGKKVCFGARRLEPDVGARASDQRGLRGYAIVEVLGLDRRRRVRSSRNCVRGRRTGVIGCSHSNTSGDNTGLREHERLTGKQQSRNGTDLTKELSGLITALGAR